MVGLDYFSVGPTVYGSGLPGGLTYDFWTAVSLQAVDYVLALNMQIPCLQRAYPGSRPVATVLRNALFYNSTTGARGHAPIGVLATGVFTSTGSGRPASALPQTSTDISGRVVYFSDLLLSSGLIPYFRFIQSQGLSLWQDPVSSSIFRPCFFPFAIRNSLTGPSHLFVPQSAGNGDHCCRHLASNCGQFY